MHQSALMIYLQQSLHQPYRCEETVSYHRVNNKPQSLLHLIGHKLSHSPTLGLSQYVCFMSVCANVLSKRRCNPAIIKIKLTRVNIRL